MARDGGREGGRGRQEGGGGEGKMEESSGVNGRPVARVDCNLEEPVRTWVFCAMSCVFAILYGRSFHYRNGVINLSCVS